MAHPTYDLHYADVATTGESAMGGETTANDASALGNNDGTECSDYSLIATDDTSYWISSGSTTGDFPFQIFTFTLPTGIVAADVVSIEVNWIGYCVQQTPSPSTTYHGHVFCGQVGPFYWSYLQDVNNTGYTLNTFSLDSSHMMGNTLKLAIVNQLGKPALGSNSVRTDRMQAIFTYIGVGTVDGVAIAKVVTVDGVAIANVEKIDGKRL